jgi:hypothetical protein
MWSCIDNQDVGLEAAIIERVRNSSLVEWLCAENVPGLKRLPKLWMSFGHGRGAFLPLRSLFVRTGGELGSENAGMSSEKRSENLLHRKPKGS